MERDEQDGTEVLCETRDGKSQNSEKIRLETENFAKRGNRTLWTSIVWSSEHSKARSRFERRRLRRIAVLYVDGTAVCSENALDPSHVTAVEVQKEVNVIAHGRPNGSHAFLTR